MPLSIDLSISCCRLAPAVFFFLVFAGLSLGALSVVAAGALADGALAPGGLAPGALACPAAGAGAFADGVWVACAGAEGAAGAAGVEGAVVVAGAADVPESGVPCASAKPDGVQRRMAVAAREAMIRMENSRS